MPYGLKNAAHCFQRNVHQLLKDLPFVNFVYMDDVIVGSKNKEDHMRDLRSLFQRIKDTGLFLNNKKCQIGRPSLTCLGLVDSRGISIPLQRVIAIKRFPVPKTPKELERFFGICAFFTVLCDTRVKQWHRSLNSKQSRQKRNLTRLGFRYTIAHFLPQNVRSHMPPSRSFATKDNH